jgi:cytochrome c5
MKCCGHKFRVVNHPTTTKEFYMKAILSVLCLTLLVFAVTAVSASDDVGQAVYTKSCAACHDSGVMGAPKVGDKDTWSKLSAEGMDSLTHNAIKGEGKMPPKGGNMKLTDEEVKAAVEYMVNKSK